MKCENCPAERGNRKRKMTTEEAKEKIFDVLISCEIGSYTTLYAPDKAVIRISNILQLIDGLTLYRARKALKLLIKDEIVEYVSQGCPNVISYGEYPELVFEAGPPINGYALTKQGFKSEEFQQAYKEWEKSMAEWANS